MLIEELSKEDWRKMDFYYKDPCSELLNNCPDEIDRVDYDKLSVEDFIEKYESKNLPVVVKGLQKDWNLEKYWTWEVILFTNIDFRKFIKDIKTISSKLVKMMMDMQ
jgi:hypothetical protein